MNFSKSLPLPLIHKAHKGNPPTCTHCIPPCKAKPRHGNNSRVRTVSALTLPLGRKPKGDQILMWITKGSSCTRDRSFCILGSLPSHIGLSLVAPRFHFNHVTNTADANFLPTKICGDWSKALESECPQRTGRLSGIRTVASCPELESWLPELKIADYF
jgi:hypothetical protein